MKLSLQFRKASQQDVQALVAIESASFPQAAYDKYRYETADFAALIEDAAFDLIVAETPDRQIAGYIAVNCAPEDKPNPNIDSLAVLKLFQGHGIGRGLLAEAERISLLKKFNALSLDVHEDNSSAIRLYQSAGYLQTGIEPAFYEDGKAAISFTKPLALSTAVFYAQLDSPVALCKIGLCGHPD